jgi:hypothetical protein
MQEKTSIMESSEKLNQQETPVQEDVGNRNLSRKEMRIRDFAQRYPLRSRWAYKELPARLYWGGRIVGLVQIICMLGMAAGVYLEKPKSWYLPFILMGCLGILACLIVVGVEEEEGPLRDNWRGIVYKSLMPPLYAQFIIYVFATYKL